MQKEQTRFQCLVGGKHTPVIKQVWVAFVRLLSYAARLYSQMFWIVWKGWSWQGFAAWVCVCLHVCMCVHLCALKIAVYNTLIKQNVTVLMAWLLGLINICQLVWRMFSFHVETDKHTGFRGIFKHVAMQTMKIGDMLFLVWIYRKRFLHNSALQLKPYCWVGKILNRQCAMPNSYYSI